MFKLTQVLYFFIKVDQIKWRLMLCKISELWGIFGLIKDFPWKRENVIPYTHLCKNILSRFRTKLSINPMLHHHSGMCHLPSVPPCTGYICLLVLYIFFFLWWNHFYDYYSVHTHYRRDILQWSWWRKWYYCESNLIVSCKKH